jgi:MoaA/NifB/PqqE/SkfB family radical SAM enzyme
MYSCRPGQGSDMNLKTFQEAVGIAETYNSIYKYIAIGGGEPTLHSDFIIMLNHVVSTALNYIYVVTNGTCDEEKWNALINIVKESEERVTLGVSNDPWHDKTMIKKWVKDDADRLGLWHRGNRNRYCTIITLGRAKKNIDRLVNDIKSYGYVGANVRDCETSVRVDPEGWVWAETSEMIKVGSLSETSVDKAYKIVQKFKT